MNTDADQSDLTPEQRGLANIVEATEQGDYMPKYLPPMYEDAEDRSERHRLRRLIVGLVCRRRKLGAN